MHILAIKKEALANIPRPENATGMVLDAALPDLVIQEDLWLGPRKLLEEDEGFRQIITQAIVVREDGRVLLHRRTSKGGEAMLHNKASITFGGHIDLSDIIVATKDAPLGEVIDLEATIYTGLLRELSEELNIDAGFGANGVNYEDARHWTIIDDSNAVGRVHIGAVYFFKVSDDFAKQLANTEIEDHTELLGWYTLEALIERANDPVFEMENWSRMLARCQLW